MRTHFDLEVRTDTVSLLAERLDQQNETKVSVLQLELIPGITPHPTRMPLMPSKLDHAGLFKQRQHLRPNQPVIKLANGIHRTAKQPNRRQIKNRSSTRINKHPRKLLNTVHIHSSLASHWHSFF
ncbi:hypothetical protein D3C78_1394320 [compost metagenome]